MLKFNRQFEKTFGWKMEEISTLEVWWSLAYPDPEYRNWVLNICQEEFNRAVETNIDIRPIEYDVTCKNGDIRRMTVFGSFIENDLLLTFFDVTERKAVEDQLIYRERAYRTLVESIPDLIARFDKESRALYVNSSVSSALGIPQEEIVGKTFQELPLAWNSEQNEHLISKIKQVFDLGSANMAEASLMTQKGEGIFEIRHIPEFDQQGKVISVLGLARNISDRRQAEEKRQKLQRQLANALEIAHLGHWEYHIKADVFIFNDQFYKVFRTTAEQAGGYEMSLAEYSRRFIHPEDRDVVTHEIREKIESPSTGISHQLEHRIIYADGQVGYINVRYFVIKDKSDNTVKTYGVNQDITDRKNMERHLRQAQKMESIGNLAGGIAHDFNNILSSVLGFTEIAMADAEKGSALADNLEEVFRAGIRAIELVHQILMFARRSDEALKPIQVGMVAKEVMKLIRSTTPTMIKVEQNLKSKSLINGNPTQVHQIFLNLCTNAVHAMQDTGGTLSVSLKDTEIGQHHTLRQFGLIPGNYLKITISDTGSGIDPAIIDSVFEPYFTTKAVGEGTGMGLAMVHGIIESYGGTIFVESQPGKGTEFTIYLPVTQRCEDLDVFEPEPLPLGEERILFVDDENVIAKVGDQMLERLGYSVTTINDSLNALELFKVKSDEFDLVITDMNMPNMTGDRLAVELMKIRDDIPVILCTGYNKNISNEKAAEIGIKAFVNKPVLMDDLAKTVRNVLDAAKDTPQQNLLY